MSSVKNNFSPFKLALSSIGYYLNLVGKGELHLRRQHLGKRYTATNGATYAVFRETFSDREYEENEVTLIIGFRLSLIRGSRFWHWLFQRLCILDTPIWVGFVGFKTKFWMVEPATKDYLGLYRYQGKANAKKYAEYICAVLRPVSTPGSVWYKIEEVSFKQYTEENRASKSAAISASKIQ